MTQRTEDDEIIDTALDTLAWQRREIDRLTAEAAQAAKAERDRIVAWLRKEEEAYPSSQYSVFAAMIAEEIEAGEHWK